MVKTTPRNMSMNKQDLLTATLDDKITKSKQLIFEWYHQFNGNVYVAFSGGKDSTVLLHLVRSMFPDVPAVFSNTGLEYPDIVKFVKSVDNVTIIRPKMTFKEVLETRGYPVVSKEQALYIRQWCRAKSEKQKNLRWNGTEKGNFKIAEKWKFLVNAPFKVSDECCEIMKKRPFHQYEKETDRVPYIGIMASESNLRKKLFLRTECNAFKNKHPQSRPIIFWTDEDVWAYIKRYDVPYCDLYDKGMSRTGCMFCLFGAHIDDSRFTILKDIYPKLHDYCMNKLHVGDVLDYVKSEGKINKF